eukprot:NODE_722_length_2808_cov_8.302126.p1 GENE.NODE_722_length_2808_cov_8.302126~~NODE_722_length_2808_cov_8.302126.p1  ORF type:complete len:846 (+),score=182.84 NODE_722_length_2808_cov_8.302126:173-2539(+)
MWSSQSAPQEQAITEALTAYGAFGAVVHYGADACDEASTMTLLTALSIKDPRASGVYVGFQGLDDDWEHSDGRVVPPSNARSLRHLGEEHSSSSPSGAPHIPFGRWGRGTNGFWMDHDGRRLFPRGLNFSASSKMPASPEECRTTHGQKSTALFTEHRDVSFVDRPCPLADADAHFERMRLAGVTLLRLLVPWEALEHAGPGIYDEEYIDYICKLCRIAETREIVLWIDPHQDCWSRFTGGDGAPGWTLELCGVQLSPALHATGAADLHWEYSDPLSRRHLSWPENYRRLGCSTLFSVFFGGDVFAPGTEVLWGDMAVPTELAGKSPQQVLQECYIRAYLHLLERLEGISNILGIEVMNEPSLGYIGYSDLRKADRGPMNIGISPFEQMRKCLPIWQGQRCFWQRAGVWTTDGGLMNPQHFACEEPVLRYFLPFVERFTKAVVGRFPELQVLVCPPAFGRESEEQWPHGCLAAVREHLVLATHWYDPLTIAKNLWVAGFTVQVGDVFRSATLPLWHRATRPAVAPVFGREAAVSAHIASMRQTRSRVIPAFEAVDKPARQVPTIIGEIGVPMSACTPSGASDERVRNDMLDRTMRALERDFASFTLWNYCPENIVSYGDQWNLEDLSVYSPLHRATLPPWLDPTTAAMLAPYRCVHALIRPYVLALDGEPVIQKFSVARKVYDVTFDANGGAASVLFVPALHFPSFAVLGSPGIIRYIWLAATQTLEVWAAPGRVALSIHANASSPAGAVSEPSPSMMTSSSSVFGAVWPTLVRLPTPLPRSASNDGE